MRIGMIEFVPDFIVSASILLVESHDVDHGLRMLLLFLLRDTILLQQSLPFLGKTGELASLVIVAHMSNMDWVFRGGNLGASGRA